MILDQGIVDKCQYLAVLRQTLIESFHCPLTQSTVGLVEQGKNLAEIQLCRLAVFFKREGERRGDFRKQPAKGIAAGIVFLIDDFLLWFRESMRAITAQALEIMAITCQCRIVAQALGGRIVSLEPLDFEKKQEIMNFG